MGKLDRTFSVITGAASGIGAGIALAFAREGSDICVVDISDEQKAQPVLHAIEQCGRRAIFVRADVSDEQQTRAMAEKVVAVFGRVDILVNNAGIFTQSLLENLPVSDWDRVVGVNLRGTFLCTRFLLPQMLARRSGRIINIASQLGQIGGVEVVHYSASKGGVIAFTKALAREVASRNVLINAIAPGPIQTH